MRLFKYLVFGISFFGAGVSSYELEVENPESIRYVAKQVAKKLIEFYPGNKPGGTPGIFGEPYYWWEGGAAMGALVDYSSYTGDSSYNKLVSEALLHQVGPDKNYMPPNQTHCLGNDDQAFWGLAAMSAAEKNFPNPPHGKPQWLPLAQAVFNTQAPRWEEGTCGGGLRWQIYSFNNGYNYKNTVSNGCFFLLGARLARFTGNGTYAAWAEKTWDWTEGSGLVGPGFRFYDGVGIENGCSKIDPIQWSYNTGLYLAGAAFMYNYTNGDEKWGARVKGILDATQNFFRNGVMIEPACEPWGTCNTDQRSFKAYLSRFMASTAQMVPWTEDIILPLLKTSGVAAAKSCGHGADGNACGMRWTEDAWDNAWDNAWGVGEQLSALEAIQSNLVARARTPYTSDTGGTSVGNPAAGTEREGPMQRTTDITRADEDGAKAMTAALVVLMLVFSGWVST